MSNADLPIPAQSSQPRQSSKQAEADRPAPGAPDANAALAGRVRHLDNRRLAAEFGAQGAFLYVDDFLPAALVASLVESLRAVEHTVNRNYLPGHKQGGSVSRHALDEFAPAVAELYRSPALIGWLEQMCGDKLLPSPADDPHAYALYLYSRPGDHIGWHYDTSYYAGKRYTVLLGVVDNSSCRLDYQLHTREPEVPDVDGSIQIPPGGLVFFDGDKLRHRISPLGANEFRVSLTFEYVTDPHMRPWQRFVSNMKDAIAYFGFRQVFRQLVRPARGGPPAQRTPRR